jgi:hypothetical protein
MMDEVGSVLRDVLRALGMEEIGRIGLARGVTPRRCDPVDVSAAPEG